MVSIVHHDVDHGIHHGILHMTASTMASSDGGLVSNVHPNMYYGVCNHGITMVMKEKNKSYTPWREGPDDRWILYKIVIHMNVLIHSIIKCPLH